MIQRYEIFLNYASFSCIIFEKISRFFLRFVVARLQGLYGFVLG